MQNQISARATPLRAGFPRFAAIPACPHCGDALLAPHHSEFVRGGEIRHYWSCETCGLVSETHIDTPPSRTRFR